MAAMAAQGEQSIHFPLIFPSIPFSSHPGLLNLFTAALCLLLLFLFPFSPFCYFSALIIPIEFSYFFSFTLLSFSFPHRSLSLSNLKHLCPKKIFRSGFFHRSRHLLLSIRISCFAAIQHFQNLGTRSPNILDDLF